MTDVDRNFAMGILRILVIVPVALLIWWLHRYVPFIPSMGFGGSVALVAIVYILRRWV